MDKVYGKPPLQNVYEHLDTLDKSAVPHIDFNGLSVSDALWRLTMWANYDVRHCLCLGILDFVYHQWWKCRKCGRWFPDSDFDQAGRKELL